MSTTYEGRVTAPGRGAPDPTIEEIGEVLFGALLALIAAFPVTRP